MEMGDARFQRCEEERGTSLGRERAWRGVDGAKENDDMMGELVRSKNAVAAAAADR
jgi:hypothetical protein